MDDQQYNPQQPQQPYGAQPNYAQQPYGQQPTQQPYGAQQPRQSYPGQPYAQQSYAPQQQPDPNDPAYKVVSIGDWLLTFFVSGIPVVGFIMLIVWLVSSSTAKSKKNYLIAGIIWGAVISLIFVIIGVIIAAVGISVPGLLDEFVNEFGSYL